MLTWEEDVQAHALRERGWTIAAIARHLGKDRKTIRAYLSGQRTPGVRRPAGRDAFEEFEGYVRARFRDDVHVPLSTLYDELVDLGLERSYQSFTRMVRLRGLRPACPSCAGVSGRATIDIAHEPGVECQWDWVELPGAPWLPAGADAHLLVGALAFSGRARAVFADAEDQPHLIEALEGVSRRLGGVSQRWRFDRMGTVVHVGTDRILASFAEVAKHYGVEVVVCPPYRANRKGAVEKAIDYLTQRWWRSADVDTPTQAQASLDAFLAGAGDARVRHHEGRRTTVAELAMLERLRPLPARAFPAELTRETVVDRDATVAFEGNRYGVTPGLIGQAVVVRHRLGTSIVEVVTPAGLVLAAHERAPAGAHRVVRSHGQRAALERVVLAAAATQGRPCKRKTHRPLGDEAKTEAQRLRRRAAGDPDEAVVIDLAVYQQHLDDLDDHDSLDHTLDLGLGLEPAPAPAAGFDPCGCMGGGIRPAAATGGPTPARSDDGEGV
jgi:transposase